MRFGVLSFASLALLAAPLGAEPLRAVRLEPSCPSRADEDCFTDLTSLGLWLWTLRKPAPSAADPVRVAVGAGEFRGHLHCGNGGHVTFHGADRTASRLVGSVDEFPFATLLTESCDGLGFENLTVASPRSRTGRGKAVRWSGSGGSWWRHVDLEAEYIAWYDSGCAHGNPLPPTGSHRFEDVTIRAGALGFFADCGRSELIDTRIRVAALPTSWIPLLGGGLGFVVAGVRASHRAEVTLERCSVDVDGSVAHAERRVQTLGLTAGGGGNSHPMGSGSIEMRGGSLRVIGQGTRTFGARADRFGESDANAAQVRAIGTTLELHAGSGAAGARSAGDGRIDWRDGGP